MPPGRRTLRIAAAVAGVLVGVGLAVVVARRTHSDAPAPPTTPSALVDTREHCDAIASRYRRALLAQQACQFDEDCEAESRGRFYSGLDRCARFRRKDATPESLAEADSIASAWLDRGCSSLFLTCRQERAQCKHGTCAELPPEPLPRTHRRVWCGNAFSFFVPPEVIEEKAEGDDSIVGAFAGPKMRLSYDFGRYSNSLASESVDGRAPVDEILSRKEVTLSGTPGVLVTMRVLSPQRARFLSGVHFPKVAVSEPYMSLGREDARLTMMATCDALADCAPAEGIFRSIEFH
ncbi:MAG TPA: hypothetical protein VF316_04255 [Polyangiaceae bacterium]